MKTSARLDIVLGLLGNVDGRHPRKYLDDRREIRDGVIVL